MLLYYKYVDLEAHQSQLHGWMLSLCQRLQLRGRVRVALDGINCTVRYIQTLMGGVLCLTCHVTNLAACTRSAEPWRICVCTSPRCSSTHCWVPT